MSNPQGIVDVVGQAATDYYNNDASNMVLLLQDVDWEVQPYSLMTRTCYVEFDPMNSRAKLPSCFARSFGSFFRNYVILQDPSRNRIQVSLERKNDKIYFSHGWSRLRDFYDIGMGAWLTILYVNPLLLHIKVKKITRIEVLYPKRNPPYRLTLPQGFAQGSSNGLVPYFMAPTVFYHRLEKILTLADVQSGILKLFWSGFCELALPHEQSNLTLVDWLGYEWKCQQGFQHHPHKTCQIYGEWDNICKTRHLVENMTLKFGVTHESNNTVIHFKVSPFIGVRTTLIAPTTSGGYKAFFQTQQYFML